MTSGRFGATFRQIETLMRTGPIGNLSDGQLLERFLDRREGGRRRSSRWWRGTGAWSGRLPPRAAARPTRRTMPSRRRSSFWCGRRARSGRRNRSGPWLHGVARRVSMRPAATPPAAAPASGRVFGSWAAPCPTRRSPRPCTTRSPACRRNIAPRSSCATSKARPTPRPPGGSTGRSGPSAAGSRGPGPPPQPPRTRARRLAGLFATPVTWRLLDCLIAVTMIGLGASARTL